MLGARSPHWKVTWVSLTLTAALVLAIKRPVSARVIDTARLSLFAEAVELVAGSSRRATSTPLELDDQACPWMYESCKDSERAQTGTGISY